MLAILLATLSTLTLSTASIIHLPTALVGETAPTVPEQCIDQCPKYMDETVGACYALITGNDHGPSLEKTCREMCITHTEDGLPTDPELMACVTCIHEGDQAVFNQWAMVNQAACAVLIVDEMVDEMVEGMIAASTGPDSKVTEVDLAEIEESLLGNGADTSTGEEVIGVTIEEVEEVVVVTESEVEVETMEVSGPTRLSDTLFADEITETQSASASVSSTTTVSTNATSSGTSSAAPTASGTEVDNGAVAVSVAPVAVVFAVVAMLL